MRTSSGGDRRQFLTDVAAFCFEKYGIHRTRIEDIADEAKLTRPTVYRYFRNRQDLVDAVVADKVAKIIDKFQPKIAKMSSFEEAVIEGSVLTLTASSSDELFMDLLHRAHSDRVTELAKGTSPIFAAISEPLWRPIVEEASKRGEVRSDLSASEIITWINQSHFLILLQDPNPKEIRSFMRNFVYPAIAPGASKKK